MVPIDPDEEPVAKKLKVVKAKAASKSAKKSSSSRPNKK
jgi:hypothetical protein